MAVGDAGETASILNSVVNTKRAVGVVQGDRTADGGIGVTRTVASTGVNRDILGSTGNVCDAVLTVGSPLIVWSLVCNVNFRALLAPAASLPVRATAPRLQSDELPRDIASNSVTGNIICPEGESTRS